MNDWEWKAALCEMIGEGLDAFVHGSDDGDVLTLEHMKLCFFL